MIEHDMQVGALLKKLDDLGISDNTIVVYTTDNGAMAAFWPDAGTTPFRSEKATTWEGGVRVPLLIRWPAKIAKGKVSNGIQEHTDLFTTLAAAAGRPNVNDELRNSHKVHIDGVKQSGSLDWRCSVGAEHRLLLQRKRYDGDSDRKLEVALYDA